MISIYSFQLKIELGIKDKNIDHRKYFFGLKLKLDLKMLICLNLKK